MGCGRRVSLKRRFSTSSDPSKKSTVTGVPFRRISWSISGNFSRKRPSRASTTRAARRTGSPRRWMRSTKGGMSRTGRLSTVKKPMSSRQLAARDLPEPERPVTMTSRST
jgi:hypothetical protein